MASAGFIAAALCFLLSVAVLVAWSYILPRAFGLLGLFGAHLFCMAGVLVAVIGFNDWLDLPEVAGEPLEFFIVFIPLGVAFNTCMLPVSIWAMFRWRRLSPLSPRYCEEDT